MHIADVLSPATAIGTGVVASAAVAVSLRRVRQSDGDRLVPLMGVMSAGVFAAQMVNFPVLPGTSGHLMGAALTTVVLGPWAAMLAMTVVVIAQCLLFYDGGLTALGANILNMAVAGCLSAHLVNTIVRQLIAGPAGRVAGAVVAAWSSVVMSAAMCSVELAASGIAPLSLVFAAMTGIHSLIGVGEAWITGTVVAFLLKVRPEMLYASEARLGVRQLRPLVAGGMAAALLVAFCLSPLASAAPDGLEAVAARLGFEQAEAAPPAVPMPDYQMPGLGKAWLATSLAGIAGAMSVFGLAWLVGRGAAKARPQDKQGQGEEILGLGS
ncbi:MAG: energy-coupling factor ABC transporter permease [Pirellulales bacterium]